MDHSFASLADSLAHGFDTLIDVRAPVEFAEDHIPGAINLPVLDDAQRAEVGTIYKQVNAFTARKVGAALVARNTADHVEGPLAAHDGGWQPLVYCWRGGQRSNAFASILSQIGWRVAVVDGGYRSFRRLVKTALYDTAFPCPVVLLDGNTGTAKTELLARVAARGHQVLDLEGLAGHRGSLFGAQGEQPSQKGFETLLASAANHLTPGMPVLIEAESSKIGSRVIPPSLWAAMLKGRRITLEVPLPARAEYLVRAYGDIIADAPRLDRTLSALHRLQGEERIARWRALAGSGDFRTLAGELMEQHYDPRYRRQRGTVSDLARLDVETLDDDGLNHAADRISDLLHGI